MQKIFTLGLLLSIATALPTGQDNSNGSLAVQPAIIDGTQSSKSNYREVAIVSGTEPFVRLCSGVLIKRDWVLTSAYCVKGQSNLRVLVGKSAIDPSTLGQQGTFVNTVIVHPSYNSIYFNHDIALLYARDVANAPGTALALLPDLPNTAYEFVGKNGVVAGFGIAGNSVGAPGYELRSKAVEIIDNNLCISDGYYMSNYKLCTPRRAICLGDEGAPLTIDNTVVGIASEGLRVHKCEERVSAAYTRVNYYRRWIDEQIYLTCRC